MIASVDEFVRYFEGVRRRTWVAVDRVTPVLADWRPRADEFTCGDIIRHLAGAERFFVTKVSEDRWTTDLDPGSGLDSYLAEAGVEPPQIYGYRMEDVLARVGGMER